MWNRTLQVSYVILAVTGVALALTGGRQDAAQSARVERGRYLVNAAGCVDCHAPKTFGPDGPAPDEKRSLSGQPQDEVLPAAPAPAPGPWIVATTGTLNAWSGPWGTSFAANLTPDPETGLGRWTPDDFVQTIRSGRHQGRGRPILPPMPIPALQHLTDEDLRAIFAYLQSLPPIVNKVPEPLPPPAAR
jgi:mono/diheme cytochrome c family protein